MPGFNQFSSLSREHYRSCSCRLKITASYIVCKIHPYTIFSSNSIFAKNYLGIYLVLWWEYYSQTKQKNILARLVALTHGQIITCLKCILHLNSICCSVRWSMCLRHGGKYPSTEYKVLDCILMCRSIFL